MGGLSVGRKLSSATLVVVVLVAIAVYVGLSRYERRSLMLAKEKAAGMVMQLLAANLSAPLTFADATSVGETVASLASNPEIELGAAWALDPAHPAVLGAPLSEPGQVPPQRFAPLGVTAFVPAVPAALEPNDTGLGRRA